MKINNTFSINHIFILANKSLLTTFLRMLYDLISFNSKMKSVNGKVCFYFC